MSMGRAEITTYLAGQLAALTTETGQAVTDSALGFGPAIDDALRRIGVSEAGLATATATDAQAPAVLAMARYYALRRIAQDLAVRVDYASTAVEGDRDRLYAHVRELMQDAAGEAASFGYSMDGSGRWAGAWSRGTLTLDALEPDPGT